MITAWDNALSVGHQRLDSQHKRLINQLNELVARIEAPVAPPEDNSPAVLEAALVLFELLRDHCLSEEAVMRQSFFTNIESHSAHHQAILTVLAPLLVERPSVAAIRDNLETVRAAVVEHILRDDLDFGAHLKAMGLFGTL